MQSQEDSFFQENSFVTVHWGHISLIDVLPRASSRHRIMDYPWWQSSGIQIIMLNAMSPVILFLWLLFYTSDLLSSYCNMAIYGNQCYFLSTACQCTKDICGVWMEINIFSTRKIWSNNIEFAEVLAHFPQALQSCKT